MLRENQVEPVRLGVEFFKVKKPRPSLIIAPTAFGKSHVISAIAHEVGKVIVLQPSKELLVQNYSKLLAQGGKASIYSASMNTKEIGDITYGTVGSIVGVGHRFETKNLIIDEADRYPRGKDGMLQRFIVSAGITHVLGLTATPLKLQTNSDGFSNFSMLKMLTSRSKKGNFFKDILHVCQVQEMVKLNYWTPLEYELHDFAVDDLVFNSTKAEFTEESLARAYEKQSIKDKIIDRVDVSRKSILIFVPSVQEAHDLASEIPGSEVVWGAMSIKERDRVIKGFKNLSIRVVINVNVLSIGFDHPELDCIICGRPTASLSWWYQAVGRITRIHPNKKNGLIIDLVGNTKKFGKIEGLYFKKEKDWQLYGEGNKLLTGIPMHEIGVHVDIPQPDGFSNVITFGKFSGTKVVDTPEWWRKWMLENFDFTTATRPIEKELLKLKG